MAVLMKILESLDLVFTADFKDDPADGKFV